MKIDSGYKRTEIGIIPSDWEVYKLSKIGESIIGLTYSPSSVKQYGTLVLRSSNVQNGRLSFDDNVYVEIDLPKRVIVKENDILICVRNGSRQLIGKCTLIDKKTEGSAFGAFMSVYRSEFSNIIFHQFQSLIIQRQINETLGATINQITNKDLASFQIPLPPTKAEQTAIATTLNDADKLITALEKLIAKKRAIKQGAMQALLTGKRRLPGFQQGTGYKETEVGVIPSDWIVGKLSDLSNMKSGETITSKRISDTNTYPCFGGNGLRGYTSEYTHDGKFALIGRQGALCGNIQFVENKFFASEHAVVVTPKNNTDIRWLYFMLVNMKLNRYSESSAQPGLSVSKILDLPIPIPSTKAEQTAIATVLNDLDSEIEALERKLKKYKMLKQGMMQNLLTGRIRLV